MSKKFLVIFISIIIIVGVAVILLNKKDNEIEVKDEITIESNTPKVESEFDENTSLYYIKDEETGEILGASQDETDLKFYEENPDYNPNPLQKRSTNIEDYYSYSD